MSFINRQAHFPSFCVKVDGFPFLLVEELMPTRVTIAIKGDVNAGSEYMHATINGTQIGGNLRSGFQDDVFRDVITDFNVESLIGENPVVNVSGFGSAGVDPLAGLTNSMRFTFTDPIGDTFTIQLDDVESGNTVTGLLGVTAQSVCLVENAINTGSENIDLDTMASTGASGNINFRASAAVKPYLERLKRENFFVVATANESTSTITLNRATAALDDKVIFISGETLLVKSTSGDQVTVDRGQFGSTADSHFGGATSGEEAKTFVPGWTGRRLRIFVNYKNTQGTLEDTATQLFLGRVSDCPAYRNADFFELAFTDYAAHVIDKKAYLNMVQVKGNDEPSSVNQATFFFNELEGKQLEKANYTTYAKCTFGYTYRLQGEDKDGKMNAVVAYTYDAVNDSITVDLSSDMMGTTRFNNVIERSGVKLYLLSAQQVVPVSGNCIIPVLAMIESGASSGTFANYLKSAPAQTSFFEGTWRLGAAISDSFIDEQSFLDAQPRTASMPWNWMLQKEKSVGDLLSWVTSSTRSFWYVSNQGKITLKKFDLKYTANTGATVATIDSSNLLLATSDSASMTERSVSGTYRVKTNYDWNGESRLTINMSDSQTRKIFPESDGVVEFDYPFIVIDETTALDNVVIVGGYNPVSRYVLETHIRRRMKINTRGMVSLSATCAWNLCTVNLGDYVLFENDATFLFGATSLRWLVVGKQLNFYQGTVQFDLVAVDAGRVIAVSGEISAWDGATNKITFDASDPEWNGNDPTGYFAVADKILLIDQSAANTFEGTIGSIIDATNLTLTGAPTFTPAAGDIAGNTEYNTETANNQADLLFQAVDGHLGPSEDEGSRYN